MPSSAHLADGQNPQLAAQSRVQPSTPRSPPQEPLWQINPPDISELLRSALSPIQGGNRHSQPQQPHPTASSTNQEDGGEAG